METVKHFKAITYKYTCPTCHEAADFITSFYSMNEYSSVLPHEEGEGSSKTLHEHDILRTSIACATCPNNHKWDQEYIAACECGWNRKDGWPGLDPTPLPVPLSMDEKEEPPILVKETIITPRLYVYFKILADGTKYGRTDKGEWGRIGNPPLEFQFQVQVKGYSREWDRLLDMWESEYLVRFLL